MNVGSSSIYLHFKTKRLWKIVSIPQTQHFIENWTYMSHINILQLNVNLHNVIRQIKHQMVLISWTELRYNCNPCFMDMPKRRVVLVSNILGMETWHTCLWHVLNTNLNEIILLHAGNRRDTAWTRPGHSSNMVVFYFIFFNLKF